DVTAGGATDAYGVEALDGFVSAVVYGNVSVAAGTGDAFGVDAEGSGVSVYVGGSVHAISNQGFADAIYGRGTYDVYEYVVGHVFASSQPGAYAVSAFSSNHDVHVTVGGASAEAVGTAQAIFAEGHQAYVTSNGSVDAYSVAHFAIGVGAYASQNT